MVTTIPTAAAKVTKTTTGNVTAKMLNGAIDNAGELQFQTDIFHYPQSCLKTLIVFNYRNQWHKFYHLFSENCLT